MTVRDDIVAFALWGAANEPLIHYQQSRPIDGLNNPRQLPLHTDCSGFVTDCYRWAGAPDPNGNNYSGLGYTGTLLDNLEQIGLADALPADLVVYGPDAGDHVVMIVELDGNDPVCVSHGQESAPFKIRHSSETRFHRPPARVLRGAGLDSRPKPPPIAPPEEEVVKSWIMRGHLKPEVYVVTQDLSHAGHVPANKLGMTGYVLAEGNALLVPPKNVRTEVQDGVTTWVLNQDDMDAVLAICSGK